MRARTTPQFRTANLTAKLAATSPDAAFIANITRRFDLQFAIFGHDRRAISDALVILHQKRDSAEAVQAIIDLALTTRVISLNMDASLVTARRRAWPISRILATIIGCSDHSLIPLIEGSLSRRFGYFFASAHLANAAHVLGLDSTEASQNLTKALANQAASIGALSYFTSYGAVTIPSIQVIEPLLASNRTLAIQLGHATATSSQEVLIAIGRTPEDKRQEVLSGLVKDGAHGAISAVKAAWEGRMVV